MGDAKERSPPFTRHFITVRTQVFQKTGKETVDRGS